MYRPANPAPTMKASSSTGCSNVAGVGNGSRSGMTCILPSIKVAASLPESACHVVHLPRPTASVLDEGLPRTIATRYDSLHVLNGQLRIVEKEFFQIRIGGELGQDKLHRHARAGKEGLAAHHGR